MRFCSVHGGQECIKHSEPEISGRKGGKRTTWYVCDKNLIPTTLKEKGIAGLCNQKSERQASFQKCLDSRIGLKSLDFSLFLCPLTLHFCVDFILRSLSPLYYKTGLLNLHLQTQGCQSTSDISVRTRERQRILLPWFQHKYQKDVDLSNLSHMAIAEPGTMATVFQSHRLIWNRHFELTDWHQISFLLEKVLTFHGRKQRD